MDFSARVANGLGAVVFFFAGFMGTAAAAQLVAGERHVLAAPIGAQPSPEYGSAVAFQGEWAAVGDPAAGAVHLFRRDAASRSVVFAATVRPQDRVDGRFGAALTASGGRLFVGEPEGTRDANMDYQPRGATTVYRLSGDAWVIDRTVRGGAPASIAEDGFGWRVAATDRHLLVAAREERVIYAFDAAAGSTAFQRIDVEARWPTGQLWDHLSGLKSLVVDGDSAVVGLEADSSVAFHSLRWSGSRWEWEAAIIDEELAASSFGGGASLRDGHLLIPTRTGIRHFQRNAQGQWLERPVLGAGASFAPFAEQRRVALADAGAFVLENSALRFYAPTAGTWQPSGAVEAAPAPGSESRARFASALSAAGNAVVIGSPGNREPALLLGPPSAASTTSVEILAPAFAAATITVGQPTAVAARLRSTEAVHGRTLVFSEGGEVRCWATVDFEGIGRCDAVFARAGRVSLEARFDGASGLAASAAQRDLLVQPVLQFPSFAAPVQMRVGVPFRGQIAVAAVDATPPFRFEPRSVVDGVSIDAQGLISGTPTIGTSRRGVVVTVSDSSVARHGLDFRWERSFDVEVLSTATPRIGLSSSITSTLEAGVSQSLPVSLFGPADARLSVSSQTADTCRVDSLAPLAVTGLRIGLCRLAYEASGTGYASATGVWEVAVTTRGRPLMFARPDRVVLDRPPSMALPGNEPRTALIDVLGNDLYNPSDVDLPAGLTIVRQPSVGTAQIRNNGVIEYIPNSTYTAIRDALRYRLCIRGAGACSEAEVSFVARPGIAPGLTLEVEGQRGTRVVDLKAISAGGPIERRVGELVAPQRELLDVPASFGVDTPFDDQLAGASFSLRAVPANPSTLASNWRVHADASTPNGAPIALYLGLDVNANGRPEESEVRCASTGGSSSASCDTYLGRQVGQGAQAYWLLVHNRGSAAAQALVEVFESDSLVSRSPRVTVTGPTTSPSLNPAWPTRVSWDDPTLRVGDRRLVDVSYWREGTYLGDAPIRLVRIPGRPSSTALRDGVDHSFSLEPGEQHRRLYFDVPRAAADVRIDLGNAPGISLAVVRAPVQSEHDPSDAPAGPVLASLAATGADKTITLPTSRLTPGRWYLVPTNEGSSTAPATLRVTTSAGGMSVEPVPGHYYNPQRSGHGVFLDYAGDQWVLVWYTYREDGSSVWYMTDVADRSSTSRTAPLLQFGWDRGKRVSSPVGWVSVNAVSTSAFEFSYTLHGRSGHERFERIGGPGCVSLSPGAAPFDVSGLWFAPELPGYGWSVQVDAGSRQAIAASYLYDDLGQPVWVWAQEALDAPGSTMVLQTIRFDGSCPWCSYAPGTRRADSGNLFVHVDATRIQRMQLEHSGVQPAAPHIIQWQWRDPASRAVVQISQPSGCR